MPRRVNKLSGAILMRRAVVPPHGAAETTHQQLDDAGPLRGGRWLWFRSRVCA